MADIVFNTALGREAYLASLPETSDALVMVPVDLGAATDATLRDYDTLAAVLADADVTEQTTMGRKTLTSVTQTVDDANDRVNIDAADVTWTAATGDPVDALIVCYVPDTGTSTDSDMIPMSKHDWAVTPDGSDVTATIADLIRIASAA